MLKVGEIAPEIRSVATDGSTFVLSKQKGLCTIVYFYPRAFTPNCTVETRRFRDNYTELMLAGASIVGVSTDDGKTQCRFAEEMRTPFPLIADQDKSISRAYDVLWPLLGMARRVTYIIGPDRTVLAQFRHELQVVKHRDEVLRFVHDRLNALRAT
jgi:thioredoxin-dependent peroxiredoxin